MPNLRYACYKMYLLFLCRDIFFIHPVEPVPAYQQLGCFRAVAKKKPKPLRIKYMKLHNQLNKKKQTTIDQCARVARAKGFEYFAVQNNAECWSDKEAKDRYSQLGSSGNCKDGVGLKGANMVYKFQGEVEW